MSTDPGQSPDEGYAALSSSGASPPSRAHDETVETPNRADTPTAEPSRSHKAFPAFPGYRVESVLGEGGMGIVYRARHVRLDRAVAIKTLLSGGRIGKDLLQRMLNEIDAIARLTHPGIIQILDSGQVHGIPFYVMELVDGSTLTQSMAQGPMGFQKAATLCRDLARAIGHAHENGIVHRDLKPSNVLLTREGTPRITDFGIAKRNTLEPGMTATGAVLGTPGYLSPEQALGNRDITPASDIFSIGVILYEMVTGRRPFDGVSEMEILSRIIRDDPPSPAWYRPGMPRDLETICLKCLQKKPARRYQSAKELEEDLDRFLNHRVILARRTGHWERAVKWCRRHPAWATLAGMLALTIPAVIVGLTIANRQLADGIERRQRLLDNDQRLAKWIIEEHLEQLGTLKGATGVELQLALKFREFLAETRANAPAGRELTLYLANAYESVADILGGPRNRHLGRLSEAYDDYTTAIALLDSLRRSEKGKSPEIERRYLRCRIKLAGVVWSTDRIETAVAILDEVQPELESLYGAEQARWMPYLLYLYQTRFDIARAQLDLDSARGWFDRIEKLAASDRGESLGTERLEELRKFLPQWISSNRSALLTMEGKHAEALELRLKDLELARISVEEPDVIDEDRLWLIQCLIDVSDELAYVPDLEQAESLIREALDRARELVRIDPANIAFRETLANACSRLSGVLFQQKRFEESLQPGIEAISILREVTGIDRNNHSTLRNLRITLSQTGGSHSQLEQLDEAEKCFREELEIAKRLSDLSSESMEDTVALAEAYADLGSLSFKRWTATIETGEIAEILKSPLRKSADEYYRLSIEAYNLIDARFELTPAQASNREASMKLKGILDDTARQLEKLLEKELF